MKKKIILNAIILIFFNFFSCNDKIILEPRKPVENILCNGAEINSYYPITNFLKAELKSSNSMPPYTEKQTFHSDTVINLMDYKIISSEIFIDTSSTGILSYNYFRSDSEGNVYKYFPIYTEEYLHTPMLPIANEVIANYAVIDGSYSRKIMDTNASFITAACEYVGLLKIEETVDTEDDEPIVNTYYYMKGLGLIAKEEQIGLNIIVTTLVGVSFE